METTTSITTTISTADSKQRASYFEWYGGRNVFICSVYDDNDDEIVAAFDFAETPTLEQVVLACEAYFS